MRIDRTKPQTSSGGGEYELLETDVYEMKIVEAKLEDDTYNPREDGSFPTKLVITWEEPESGTRVWQRFNPYYGTTKDGAPSKFMAFVDLLADQGLLNDQFDVETDLVGIRQRVSVEKYIKSMGPNKGKPGNRVTAVLPLKPHRAGRPAPKTAQPIDDDPIPF